MTDSVWYVVDAINKTESLNIKYPEDHEKQQKMLLALRLLVELI